MSYAFRLSGECNALRKLEFDAPTASGAKAMDDLGCGLDAVARTDRSSEEGRYRGGS